MPAAFEGDPAESPTHEKLSDGRISYLCEACEACAIEYVFRAGTLRSKYEAPAQLLPLSVTVPACNRADLQKLIQDWANDHNIPVQIAEVR